MLLVVKDDESPDPVDVRVLGPPTVVPCSHSMAHAIEELRLRSRLGERDDRWCRETIRHVRVVSEQRTNTIAAEKPNESSAIVVRRLCFCDKRRTHPVQNLPYRGRPVGDFSARDSVYHQGIVCPWTNRAVAIDCEGGQAGPNEAAEGVKIAAP